MKRILIATLLSISTAALLAGCSSAPAPTETASATAGSTQETAKCALCGKDFPKAELEMHDGALACKACVASHNH